MKFNEKDKLKKKRSEPEKKYDENGNEIIIKQQASIVGIVKAVIYIVCILIISLCASYYIISIGNDVFAFVKKDTTCEIHIKEYTTSNELANILYDNDIISYPSVFKMYAGYREPDAEYIEGTYQVSSALNYDELMSLFKAESSDRSIVVITIPEGYTIDDIIDIFVGKGIGTREGFVDAIQNYDYDFKFIDLLDKNISKDRKYRLEGYLFPDTYYFYEDWEEYLIINKLLEGFEAKFDKNYYDDIEKMGMTLDEVITLASMIEKEAKYVADYEFISSVFHNRLDHSSNYPFLESDATIQYALPEHKATLTHDDTKYDSPYNTYRYKGLPPGPICNPGVNAILYAMNPAKSNYYYFVSYENGTTLYAKDYKTHLQNIDKIEADEKEN